MESNKKDIIKEFIEKCKKDMQKAKQDMLDSLSGKESVTNAYLLYAYKITMYDEILQMFMSNQGGVGYWAKAYNGLENPLEQIFDDIITEYTEPTLLTENKLYRVLDRKGLGI